MTATCPACGAPVAETHWCPHCDQPCPTLRCPQCKTIDRYLGTGPATTRP